MFAQILHNILTRVPYRGWSRRTLLKAATVARHALIRKSDPLVMADVGAFRLRMPLSHQFPHDRKAFSTYNTAVVEAAQLVAGKYPDFKAIDVGANVGDTMALWRTEAQFPILAIEGEDRFFNLLKQNVGSWPDIRLEKTYLGDKEGRVAADITSQRGTSRITTDSSEPSDLRIETLVSVLNRHPDYVGARMLKIDTDGFDYRILRGAIPWFTKHNPVLFFEYDPALLRAQHEDPASMFPELRHHGYRWLAAIEEMGSYTLGFDLEGYFSPEALEKQFAGGAKAPYADLCVFGDSDHDLFQALIAPAEQSS